MRLLLQIFDAWWSALIAFPQDFLLELRRIPWLTLVLTVPVTELPSVLAAQIVSAWYAAGLTYSQRLAQIPLVGILRALVDAIPTDPRLQRQVMTLDTARKTVINEILQVGLSAATSNLPVWYTLSRLVHARLAALERLGAILSGDVVKYVSKRIPGQAKLIWVLAERLILLNIKIVGSFVVGLYLVQIAQRGVSLTGLQQQNPIGPRSSHRHRLRK